MLGRLKRLISVNLFKIRYVFCLKLSKDLVIENEDTGFVRVSENEHGNLHQLIFEMLESDDGDVMGYTNLAVNSGDKPIWHDNYPIRKGEGFIYGSFVNKKFRGRGLYVSILNYVTNYMKDKNVEKLVAVVESANFPSARSHTKSGYRVCGSNYLVKFFKKNILTIFNRPFGCYFAGKKSNSI